MSQNFGYKIELNQIIFNNVIINDATLLEPRAYKEGDKKSFKMRFFIPKENPNTKKMFSEIATMFDVTEAQLIRDTKIIQRSIKEASLISTNDQYFKSILSDNYIVSASAFESNPPEVIVPAGMEKIIRSHDRVRVLCGLVAFTDKQTAAKKIMFSILKVMLLESGNSFDNISEEFSDLFYNEGVDLDSNQEALFTKIEA